MPDDEPRTQPPEVRRNQILDAAATVLVQGGVGAATIDRVAREAGLGKGTVYLYFESKDALFAALRNRYDEDLLVAAGEELGADGDHVARLEAFLRRALELHRRRGELHRVLVHELGGSEEAIMERLRLLVAGWIAEGIRAGRFSVADTEVAARYVVHALGGMLVDHLGDDPGSDGADGATDGFVAGVVGLTVSALGGRVET